MRLAARALVAALPLAVLGATSLAGADSFTPVTLKILVTPIARRASPLSVTVHVNADPGVLDTGQRPMRVEVKLTAECGGDFQHTPGVTLVNAPLTPQPSTGKAYSGSASGSGNPAAYGTQTVCTYLEDSSVGRVYASDASTQVSVTQACTLAGSRYDAAHRALSRAQRALRRAHGKVARRRARRLVGGRRRALVAARKAGVAACGPGVPL